jgi:hypothetical protein
LRVCNACEAANGTFFDPYRHLRGYNHTHERPPTALRM